MFFLLFFITFAANESDKMKKLTYFVSVLLLSVCVCAACSKKKNQDIIVSKQVAAPVSRKVQSMSAYHDVRNADWKGEVYRVDVQRMADPSLPLSRADAQTEYYDNKVVVKVLRKDGSTFFNHTFTKKDFSSWLDEDTSQHGALLGVVFVRAEGSNLLFAVSVGSPDVNSDEYIPLVMKVSGDGVFSVSKDSQLDTGSTEGEDEDL